MVFLRVTFKGSVGEYFCAVAEVDDSSRYLSSGISFPYVLSISPGCPFFLFLIESIERFLGFCRLLVLGVITRLFIPSGPILELIEPWTEEAG